MSARVISVVWGVFVLFCAGYLGYCIDGGFNALASEQRSVNYRVTLYDGGQVIDAWICHDYNTGINGKGQGVRLTLRDGRHVWLRGTLIIEEVPAATEVR